jgi:hypothetical protein
LLIEAAGDEAEISEFLQPHPDKLFDFLCHTTEEPEVIHLNHQVVLHSNWTREYVSALQKLGYAVVITQHDTFEDTQTMREHGFPDFRTANLLVIHQPVRDIWPMGLMKGIIRTSETGILGQYGRGVEYWKQPVPGKFYTDAYRELAARVRLHREGKKRLPSGAWR